MELLNDKNFKENIAKNDLVLVDFFATWCGPCKMLSPVLEEVAKDNEDMKFFKVDVDQNPDLVREFGIQAMPTIVILRDGKEIKRFLGYKAKEQIQSIIDEVK